MNKKEIINALKNNELLEKTNGDDISFSYFSYDSNDIKDNTLFICKGLTFKEEYLLDAIKKGVTCYISEVEYTKEIPYIIVNDVRKAMAVVAELFFNDTEKKLTLIGVTGTKGKTTTVNFIKNILEEETGYKIPYMSTIDYYTGKRAGKSHNTTAESIDIYKCINDAKSLDLKYMAMEVSSQATKLDRIYNMQFDIGIFVNIGLDHISPLEHKDFKEYLSCKVQFLKQSKTVIIYRGSEKYEEIIRELSDKKIITYGEKDADYIVSNIHHDGIYTTFSITHNEKTKEYKISMLGNFNCLNACAAIIASELLGVSYLAISKGLIKTEVLGRMNVFNGKSTIIVDYAHNKLSLEALIKAMKETFPGKNMKLVFGCPGDRGINRREEMGTLAGLYGKHVYITAEDPQTKDVLDISKEIASFVAKGKATYEIIPDRELAIKKAYNDSGDNDIILVLGKGDETYQIVNHVYVPYKSDVVVAKELTTNVLVK